MSLRPRDVPLSLRFLPRSRSLGQSWQEGSTPGTLQGWHRLGHPWGSPACPQGPAHPQRVAPADATGVKDGEKPLREPKQDRRTRGCRAAPCLSFPPAATVRPPPGGKAAPQLGRRRRRRKRRKAAPSRAHKAPFIGAEFGFPLPAQHLAASCPARNAAVRAGGWRVGRLGGHRDLRVASSLAPALAPTVPVIFPSCQLLIIPLIKVALQGNGSFVARELICSRCSFPALNHNPQLGTLQLATAEPGTMSQRIRAPFGGELGDPAPERVDGSV